MCCVYWIDVSLYVLVLIYIAIFYTYFLCNMNDWHMLIWQRSGCAYILHICAQCCTTVHMGRERSFFSSTFTNTCKFIVFPCLLCFGCGQAKLVLNSVKCFVANDPWISVSPTFVGSIAYRMDWFGRDWRPCAVATLRTDILPCVSFSSH